MTNISAVKVLVPLIDNGILYLPGDTIELDESVILRGIGQQLYERLSESELAPAQNGENDNG